MFKLIVSDMDGTLLNDDKKVSNETKEAIKKLENHGARFTIATGRIYPAAKVYSDELGVNAPLICCNGALIIDPLTDEILYGSVISKDIGVQVIEVCEAFGVYYHLYDKDTIYSDRMERVIAYFNEFSKTLPEAYKIKTKIVDSTRDLFEETTIYKIGIYYDNSENALNMRKALEKIPGATGFKSLETMYDVLAEGTNKGTALRRLCEILNYDLNEVVAFGDNENDLEMLEAAGYGIAMGNAEEFVKDVADHVAETNEADGVRLALEKIFKMV
jgi:Cof subfamily protein (haloacid dehalogenase superfamily)